MGGLIGAAIALVFAPRRHESIAPSAESVLPTATQPNDYEAPRIVLDEGINASASTDG